MQSFIVLGIIPGTNIQTNLNFWIYVAIILTILASYNQLNNARKHLRKHFALRQIAYTIEHYDFVLVQ